MLGYTNIISIKEKKMFSSILKVSQMVIPFPEDPALSPQGPSLPHLGVSTPLCPSLLPLLKLLTCKTVPPPLYPHPRQCGKPYPLPKAFALILESIYSTQLGSPRVIFQMCF